MSTITQQLRLSSANICYKVLNFWSRGSLTTFPIFTSIMWLCSQHFIQCEKPSYAGHLLFDYFLTALVEKINGDSCEYMHGVVQASGYMKHEQTTSILYEVSLSYQLRAVYIRSYLAQGETRRGYHDHCIK